MRRVSCTWWPLAAGCLFVCFSARLVFVDRYTNTGRAGLVAVDQVLAGLGLAGLVAVDQVLAGLVLAGLGLAGLGLAGLGLAALVAVDQVLAALVLAALVLAALVLAGLVPRSAVRGPCSVSECPPLGGPKNGPGRWLRWL